MTLTALSVGSKTGRPQLCALAVGGMGPTHEYLQSSGMVPHCVSLTAYCWAKIAALLPGQFS